MIKKQRLLLRTGLGVLTLFVAGLWKMQVVFGSHLLLFSGLNILGPLVGFGTGSGAVLAIFSLKRMISWSFLGSPFISPFSSYIPTLCAAWYWSMPSKAIRLFLPIVCMIAFMVHPVGAQAWVYALYWLIPVALYFFPNKPLFLQAVSSSFIQHAVGSVIWLYCAQSTPALWYGLLPIVMIERLLFASGMVVAIHCMQVCRVIALPKARRFYSFLFA